MTAWLPAEGILLQSINHLRGVVVNGLPAQTPRWGGAVRFTGTGTKTLQALLPMIRRLKGTGAAAGSKYGRKQLWKLWSRSHTDERRIDWYSTGRAYNPSNLHKLVSLQKPITCIRKQLFIYSTWSAKVEAPFLGFLFAYSYQSARQHFCIWSGNAAITFNSKQRLNLKLYSQYGMKHLRKDFPGSFQALIILSIIHLKIQSWSPQICLEYFLSDLQITENPLSWTKYKKQKFSLEFWPLC